MVAVLRSPGQRPDGRVTRKEWKIMATQPLIEDFRSKKGGDFFAETLGFMIYIYIYIKHIT